MTMFANSSMTVTIEDAIEGMERLLKRAQENGRDAAVRAYKGALVKLRNQTTEEFRKNMGLPV